MSLAQRTKDLLRGPSLLRITLWHLLVILAFASSMSFVINMLLTRSSYAEIDGVLVSLNTAVADILQSELSESGLDELAARDAVRELQFENYRLAVYDEFGNLLAEHPAGMFPAVLSHLPPGDGIAHLANDTDASHVAMRIAESRVRLEPVGRTYVIVASHRFDSPLAQLAAQRRAVLILVALAVLLAVGLSFYLIRSAFQPALLMSRKALTMGVSDLGERFPLSGRETELDQLAANFNGLLARLDTSFDSQRRFMADASHELRTPLSVIGTTAAVMLDSENSTNAELRDGLRTIQQQASRLRRVVEDMFYLARADSGAPSLRLERVQLDELLLETVRAVSRLAQAKQLRIHLNTFVEAEVLGDADLLHRVFVNLLANAVKFSPAGGEIRVDLDHLSSSERYRVRISNAGAEIAPADRERIFDRFFRVDGQASEGSELTGGAGLGLAIARSILEMHGGSLVLESSDAGGTVFACMLNRTAS